MDHLPSDPIECVLLLYLMVSPPLLLAVGLQYVLFIWIRNGLRVGERRGEWLMRGMRRRLLYAGMTDEAICQNVCALCLLLLVLFGTSLVIALGLHVLMK